MTAFLATYIMPVLAGLAAVVVAWFTGRRAGESKAEADRLKDRLEAVERAREIEDAVQDMDADAVRERIARDWLRDPNGG